MNHYLDTMFQGLALTLQDQRGGTRMDRIDHRPTLGPGPITRPPCGVPEKHQMAVVSGRTH